MVMKRAKIAELKARLSEYLREVRSGRSLVVMDRNTPVARLVPYAPEGEALSVRKPLGRSPSLRRVPLPSPLETGVDVVELLLEERQGAR
jgi:prevent-host-death family protein